MGRLKELETAQKNEVSTEREGDRDSRIAVFFFFSGERFFLLVVVVVVVVK